MGEADIRASDAERERVVEALRAAGLEGRLTADELEDRTGRALGARTRAELGRLLQDLPSSGAAPVPAARREHPLVRLGKTVVTISAACVAVFVGLVTLPVAFALLIAGVAIMAAFAPVLLPVFIAVAVVAWLLEDEDEDVVERTFAPARGEPPRPPSSAVHRDVDEPAVSVSVAGSWSLEVRSSSGRSGGPRV